MENLSLVLRNVLFSTEYRNLFTLMVVHRNQYLGIQELFQLMQYLLANSTDIAVGDFNHHLLKVSQNKLLDIFPDHV